MIYYKKSTVQTLEVKQSKFIAHLFPYSDFKKKMAELKSEHPKARHFVVAWRYINEYDQIVEYSSDDGEPKGTSGKPTLSVLSGKEIVNTAVIIVRYFGGTKLGTGGLVKAYSDACNLVIQHSQSTPYVKLKEYVFSVNYTNITVIEHRLDALSITVKDKLFDENGAFFTVLADEKSWRVFHNENERIAKLSS